jgi:hypothetical protein
MEQDASVQAEGTFDPSLGMVITEAGKQRMRQRLAERRASRDVDAIRALRDRLRLGPAANA